MLNAVSQDIKRLRPALRGVSNPIDLAHWQPLSKSTWNSIWNCATSVPGALYSRAVCGETPYWLADRASTTMLHLTPDMGTMEKAHPWSILTQKRTGIWVYYHDNITYMQIVKVIGEYYSSSPLRKVSKSKSGLPTMRSSRTSVLNQSYSSQYNWPASSS